MIARQHTAEQYGCEYEGCFHSYCVFSRYFPNVMPQLFIISLSVDLTMCLQNKNRSWLLQPYLPGAYLRRDIGNSN